MSNLRLIMPTTKASLLDKVLHEMHHKPDDPAAYNHDKAAYLARFKLDPDMHAVISRHVSAGCPGQAKRNETIAFRQDDP